MQISDFSSPWLAPGADLIFTVEISNGTDQEVPLKEIAVGAQRTPANSQYLLYYWMNNVITAKPLFSFPTDVKIPAGEIKRIKVQVPRAHIPWSTARFGWGPRGVEACAVSANPKVPANTTRNNLCDRSVTVAAADEQLAPMPVSVVFPLSLNSAEILAQPSITDILLEKKFPKNTAITPDTAQKIQKTINTFNLPGVNYFADPWLLENLPLAQTINSADAAGKYLLPYADIDIQALISANHSEKLSEAFALSSSIQNSSAAGKAFSPEKISFLQGPPNLKELQELAALGVHTAIVPGAQRSTAHEFFYTQEATRKVSLHPDGTAPRSTSPNGNAIPAENPSEQAFTLLLSNDQISAALQGRLTTYQDLQGINLSLNDRAQVSLALSAIHFNEAPNYSRPLLVQVPRTVANQQQNQRLENETAKAVKALTQAPWLSAGSLSAIVNDKAPIREIPDSAQFTPEKLNAATAANAPISPAEISELLNAEKSFLQKARIFTNFNTFLSFANRKSLTALSAAWRGKPKEFAQYLDRVFKIESIKTGLVFEPSSTINMISESSSLPVRIANNFHNDVQVQIDLVSPDNRLSSDKTAQAVLPANQTTSISVPVKAHGSGNIRVLLRILDADGNDLDAHGYLNMRIRADWENIGTAIIATFFGIILVYGIYRSVKDGRRAKPMTQQEIDFANSDAAAK